MARICIVRQNFYPYAMDYHVQRDAQTLLQDGHEVDVVCLREPGAKRVETVNGVRVYRLPVGKARGGLVRYLFEYGAFFMLTFLLLSFLAVRRRYQAVEIDTMPDALAFTALVPKMLGAKVVLYLFEAMPEQFMDAYDVSDRHPLTRTLRFIEARASRFADHVIYCAPGCRAIQEPRVGKRVEASVILNVPDHAVFRPEDASLPASTREGRAFRIVTHGSLLEKYGVQTLVEAAALLKGRIPDFEVRIAGDGNYREQLEALSRSVNAEDVVRFVGMLPATDIPRFLSDSDVGVVTILDGYNMLPTKLFEYFAMRRPVVSSGIKFIRDFCSNGEALFFTPGDSRSLAEQLVGVYEHPEEAQALVRQADRLFAQCQWPVMREQYLNVYRRLGVAQAAEGAIAPQPAGAVDAQYVDVKK